MNPEDLKQLKGFYAMARGSGFSFPSPSDYLGEEATELLDSYLENQTIDEEAVRKAEQKIRIEHNRSLGKAARDKLLFSTDNLKRTPFYRLFEQAHADTTVLDASPLGQNLHELLAEKEHPLLQVALAYIYELETRLEHTEAHADQLVQLNKGLEKENRSLSATRNHPARKR